MSDHAVEAYWRDLGAEQDAVSVALSAQMKQRKLNDRNNWRNDLAEKAKERATQLLNQQAAERKTCPTKTGRSHPKLVGANRW